MNKDINTMAAIWFSRHRPTATQLAEIEEKGFSLVALEEGMRLGAVDLADDATLEITFAQLEALAADNKADAVFGVFPAPIQERLAGDTFGGVGAPCYASWNVQRSVEGGKPTFEHKRFCRVGLLAR